MTTTTTDLEKLPIADWDTTAPAARIKFDGRQFAVASAPATMGAIFTLCRRIESRTRYLLDSELRKGRDRATVAEAREIAAEIAGMIDAVALLTKCESEAYLECNLVRTMRTSRMLALATAVRHARSERARTSARRKS